MFKVKYLTVNAKLYHTNFQNSTIVITVFFVFVLVIGIRLFIVYFYY